MPNDELNEKSDKYVMDYDSKTTERLAQRTADVQAAFFLPFLQPGMSLLDCGSGLGAITVGLAKTVAPAKVEGIDIGESQVEAATKRAQDEDVFNTHFQVGNVYDLPFPDGSFDAVFAHTVFEHLSEPEKAISEIYRVLKAGGIVGLRSIDIGTTIFSPTNEDIEAGIELRIKDYALNAGNPFVGRRLRGLLYHGGFMDIESSVSGSQYRTHEDFKGYFEWQASWYEQPAFVERVTKNGLATHEDLLRMSRAFRDLTNRPDIFGSTMLCEAVGHKA